MNRKWNSSEAEAQRLFTGTLWLNAKALGLVFGIVCGLVVFVATNWLVIKGGDPVGPHLELLSQYFIGYSVTFAGSFVGLLYGFALGTLSGSLIGWIYNKIARFRSQGPSL